LHRDPAKGTKGEPVSVGANQLRQSAGNSQPQFDFATLLPLDIEPRKKSALIHIRAREPIFDPQPVVLLDVKLDTRWTGLPNEASGLHTTRRSLSILL
jgi:hypothetical protein